MDQLRKRRDFLAAAKAERAGVSAFLLQGRNRGDGGDIRIGFTVTKKTGNAVVRNRIRRRLREVARQVVATAGRPGYDYVLVAREHALAAPFGSLLNDLGKALRKLHDPSRSSRPGGGPPRRGAGRSKGADSKGADAKSADASAVGSNTADASSQAVAPQPAAFPHSETTNTCDPQVPPPTEAIRHE